MSSPKWLSSLGAGPRALQLLFTLCVKSRSPSPALCLSSPLPHGGVCASELQLGWEEWLSGQQSVAEHRSSQRNDARVGRNLSGLGSEAGTGSAPFIVLWKWMCLTCCRGW